MQSSFAREDNQGEAEKTRGRRDDLGEVAGHHSERTGAVSTGRDDVESDEAFAERGGLPADLGRYGIDQRQQQDENQPDQIVAVRQTVEGMSRGIEHHPLKLELEDLAEDQFDDDEKNCQQRYIDNEGDRSHEAPGGAMTGGDVRRFVLRNHGRRHWWWVG